MNHSTNIEWTHMPGYKGETWNPVTGCTKVSPACEHCYAITMSARLEAMGLEKYKGTTRQQTRGGFNWTGRVFTHTSELDRPTRWKKPRMIFVNSMSDTFHEDVPFEFIKRIFGRAYFCPQHIFLILTKRIDRALEFYQYYGHLLTLPNVWLGTTVENQEQADKRIPDLLQCPAAVRFVSCEPLLGELDFKFGPEYNYSISKVWGMPEPTVINWVICGGESGHKARPMHPDWARSLRDQCASAGVPFFFKQWGEWLPFQEGQGVNPSDLKKRTLVDFNGVLVEKVGKHRAGRLLDGAEHTEWPWPPQVFPQKCARAKCDSTDIIPFGEEDPNTYFMSCGKCGHHWYIDRTGAEVEYQEKEVEI